MMRPRLLFYCQHSLGLGHLSRSFALCEALAGSFDVVLLCGGKLPRTLAPPDGIHIVALPPLGAAIGGRIISHDRRVDVDRARKRRRRTILKTFRSLRPDVLLIEFFPFGKKRFTNELVPLLEEARNLRPVPPLIVSSVRDILVGRGDEQEEFDDRASRLANRYFDLVLVHSDPHFARLHESFRPRVPLRVPVSYTGFVVSNGLTTNAVRTRREVVVSAGGGIAGAELLGAAVDAHSILKGAIEMKIITGPFLPDDVWRSLRAGTRGRDGLRLKRSVPDLSAELRGARASVSQCGYNTALDILRARVPALVVPFSDGGEDEQTNRAIRLQRLGAVRMLEPNDLDPSRLAVEIRALTRFRPLRVNLDLEGAPKSARILGEFHDRRRRPAS
jgi:predicted glycosyltransferase